MLIMFNYILTQMKNNKCSFSSLEINTSGVNRTDQESMNLYDKKKKKR